MKVTVKIKEDRQLPSLEEIAAMKTTKEERYISVTDVARIFAVSPKTITRWAREGKLPCMRTLGGHRRYPEQIMKALAENYTHRTEGNPVA
jgi:excisionase family DNA binding protein